jgi:hypothetical protein
MSEAIVVAAIASGPGTLAALAAWRSSYRASGKVDKVEAAVNDRAPSAPTISEDVSETRKTVENVRHEVVILRARLDEHLTRHHGPRLWR